VCVHVHVRIDFSPMGWIPTQHAPALASEKGKKINGPSTLPSTTRKYRRGVCGGCFAFKMAMGLGSILAVGLGGQEGRAEMISMSLSMAVRR